MQQCLKPYGCGDTSKTVLKIVCFGKSVFCRKNRDARIVLNVTVIDCVCGWLRITVMYCISAKQPHATRQSPAHSGQPTGQRLGPSTSDDRAPRMERSATAHATLLGIRHTFAPWLRFSPPFLFRKTKPFFPPRSGDS